MSGRPGRGPLLAAALVLAGGALRFGTLSVQSFWLDEAVTLHLLHRGFFSMLGAIPGSESTPPLYYVLAWPWARVFGFGEVGVRSLSALFGTATIALAWMAARRLGGVRAGLAAALLVAASPLLIWYSQEARAYGLLALLAAAQLVAFLDALEPEERRRRRALAAWAVLSALALAAHYFAVFPLALEGLWLLRCLGRRAVPALALPALAGLALLPLLIAQSSDERAGFIHASALGTRLIQVPKQFLVGYHAPHQVLLTVVASVAAVAALALLARDRAPARAWTLAGLLLAAAAIPILGSLVGLDYLIARNLLALLVPMLVVLGVAGARGRLGLAGVGVLAAVGLLAFALVETHATSQRSDARGAAKALAAGAGPRVVLASANGMNALSVYLHGARPLPQRGVLVRDVAWVALAPTGSAHGHARESPPFLHSEWARVAVRVRPTYTLVRWRAPIPIRFSKASFAQLTGFPQARVLR